MRTGAVAPSTSTPLIRWDACIITGSWIGSDRMSGIVVQRTAESTGGWREAGGQYFHSVFSGDFLRRLYFVRRKKSTGRNVNAEHECWKFFSPGNVEFVPFWLVSIVFLWWWLNKDNKVKGVMASLLSLRWLHNKMLFFFFSVGPQRVYNQARWHNGSSILNLDAG